MLCCSEIILPLHIHSEQACTDHKCEEKQALHEASGVRWRERQLKASQVAFEMKGRWSGVVNGLT
jgi:hypothetical protein